MKSDSLNLDLNKLMQNVGGEYFDFGTFKAAYDTDPRVKTMVRNFNNKGLEPETENGSDDTSQADPEDNSEVSQMAKRATDLGAEL